MKIAIQPSTKFKFLLPKIPSMLWFDLPPSDPLRSVHVILPPLSTLEMLDTLGALFLSQTPSCSMDRRKEGKHFFNLVL